MENHLQREWMNGEKGGGRMQLNALSRVLSDRAEEDEKARKMEEKEMLEKAAQQKKKKLLEDYQSGRTIDTAAATEKAEAR